MLPWRVAATVADAKALWQASKHKEREEAAASKAAPHTPHASTDGSNSAIITATKQTAVEAITDSPAESRAASDGPADILPDERTCMGEPPSGYGERHPGTALGGTTRGGVVLGDAPPAYSCAPVGGPVGGPMGGGTTSHSTQHVVQLVVQLGECGLEGGAISQDGALQKGEQDAHQMDALADERSARPCRSSLPHGRDIGRDIAAPSVGSAAEAFQAPLGAAGRGQSKAASKAAGKAAGNAGEDGTLRDGSGTCPLVDESGESSDGNGGALEGLAEWEAEFKRDLSRDSDGSDGSE